MSDLIPMPPAAGPDPGLPGHFAHHDWLEAAVLALNAQLALQPLPDPVQKNGLSTVTLPSSWGDIVAESMEFERRCYVLVTAGAWMRALAPSTDVRVGLQLRGATSLDHPLPNWGNVGIATPVASTVGGLTSAYVALVEPGLTWFVLRGYGTSGTTSQANYSFIQITPLRWAAAEAEAPAEG